VLSITNITAGHGGRYYSEDNYYLRSRSEWQGRGVAYLGLSGEVGGAEFKALLNGRNLDGDVLVRSAGNRHRAVVDMTFSAPKGVSILYGVAGDERLREAHERAVSLALGYAEADFSQARVTKDGVTRRVDTGNLVIATFGHDLSRELDPQLHTQRSGAALFRSTQGALLIYDRIVTSSTPTVETKYPRAQKCIPA